MKLFNAAVRFTVLTFVLVAGGVSIAGLAPATDTAPESMAIKQTPVDEPVATTKQEAADTGLGTTG